MRAYLAMIDTPEEHIQAQVGMGGGALRFSCNGRREGFA